jgi:hypothetical protein
LERRSELFTWRRPGLSTWVFASPPPFRVDGDVRVEVEHKGQGDVTVELLSDQGPSLYFLVEDSGRFTASRTAVGLEPGNYYLNIEARWSWRLTLHPG